MYICDNLPKAKKNQNIYKESNHIHYSIFVGLPVNIVIGSFSCMHVLYHPNTHSNVFVRSSLMRACANTIIQQFILY
jgi:hypothetical protein